MSRGLREKIVNRKAKIGIIGCGYVGLPLAVEFAKACFEVTGIDMDKNRVRKINQGESYILDVTPEDVTALVRAKKLEATTDYKILRELDVIIICVPTPLRKTKEPDISYIMNSAEKISRSIKEAQLVVLESTTYPGTTEEVILPMLEAKGLKVGRDFFLAFSPERVDPGNKEYTTGNIPKVVGGVTKRCTELSKLLYAQIVDRVIPVSSPKVAEMVKLLENTFRSVNIGLANELALMCDRLNIDSWEVIEAAKTKPFGFMPFYPGPGIGGECIPADPMYLSWKARLHGFEARFIDLASQVNSYMPHYVVERVAMALNDCKKPLKGSHILIVGVAYKKDVKDTRESPAFEVIRRLRDNGAHVTYHDPFVEKLAIDGSHLASVKLTKNVLKGKDCVVIVTDHSSIDYEFIAGNSKLIFDTRNAVKGNNKRIVTL